jgi:hypothetical protein
MLGWSPRTASDHKTVTAIHVVRKLRVMADPVHHGFLLVSCFKD